MAIMVLKNPYISINGVELTRRGTSITLNYESEVIDQTAFGDTNRAVIGGFKNWSVDIEFWADYDAGQVDATLFPLVGSSTFTVAIRPTTNARSSTNPEFTGTGLLVSYTPISGSAGEMARSPVRIQNAGPLSRLTS